MKFCIHDWYTHREGYKSLRYGMFINPESIAPGVAIMCTLAFMLSVITILNSTGAGVAAVIFWGVVSCLTYMGIWGITAVSFDVKKIDPWSEKDRSCLRCGKVDLSMSKKEFDRNNYRDKKARAKQNYDLAIAAMRGLKPLDK